MAIKNNVTMAHVEFVVNEMKRLVERFGCGDIYYKSDIRYGVYVDETHCGGAGGQVMIIEDMIEVYVKMHFFIFALDINTAEIKQLTVDATNLGFDVHIFELPK